MNQNLTGLKNKYVQQAKLNGLFLIIQGQGRLTFVVRLHDIHLVNLAEAQVRNDDA